MIDQRPQDGGGGGSAERADEGPVIVAGLPLPAAVAGANPRGVVEKMRSFAKHQNSRNASGASPVIARSGSDEAIQPSSFRDGALAPDLRCAIAHRGSRDSRFDEEPVIAPRCPRTRWHRPGMTESGLIRFARNDVVTFPAQYYHYAGEFNDLEDNGSSELARRPALCARLLQPLWQKSAYRHVPDILGIFADGAVGREPRHPRDVEDAGPRPGRAHLPARVDAVLGLVIGLDNRADHVVVEMAQRMPDRFEPGGIVGREFTALDRADGARK